MPNRYVSALVCITAILSGCSASTETDPTETEPTVVVEAPFHQAAQTYSYGQFTLYMPARTLTPRAVLVVLGGPDTRGVVTGQPFGAPVPALEAALQSFGADLRTLADNDKIAILGTSRSQMANSAANDTAILDGLAEGSALSGRPALDNVPLFILGISGGGPESSGFTARHAERVGGLYLRNPLGFEALSAGNPALGVPTYMTLAELDTIIDNPANTQRFLANRSAGGYWGMHVTAGATHQALTPELRAHAVSWLDDVIKLRVRLIPWLPLRDLHPTLGWIGDPATERVVPAFLFWRDRSATSWLPSREVGEQWSAFWGFNQ
jgi:pimeloyl-ACP methyl ester carboxylesterase